MSPTWAGETAHVVGRASQASSKAGMTFPQRRFYSDHVPYTTKPGGTGLGLHVVQEIMAVHSGKVAVQNAAGQGTPSP